MAEQRPARPGLAMLLLALPFLLLVLGELAIIVWLANLIGWWTIVAMAATSMLGMALFRSEGRKSLARGMADPKGLADAGLVFVGSVLLILPGFITDAVGLLFLLPFTRPLVRALFGRWLARLGRSGGSASIITVKGEVVEEEPPETDDGPLVIEGTVVDASDDEDGRQ